MYAPSPVAGKEVECADAAPPCLCQPRTGKCYPARRRSGGCCGSRRPSDPARVRGTDDHRTGNIGGTPGEEGPCDEIWAKTNISVGAPLYASQDPTFSGEFPPGVGAQLLPNLLVLQELHFINTRDVPVEVSGEINIVAAAPGTELIYANGLFGSIDDIALEPQTEVVLRQKCTVPVDMDVFVLGSHFHSRGTRFEINLLDEAGEPGELVYESTDWQSPPLDIMPTDPIHIPAGSGFSYACTFKNDTDDWIYAGESSTEEMCMMVGIYYPDAGFLRCGS